MQQHLGMDRFDLTDFEWLLIHRGSSASGQRPDNGGRSAGVITKSHALVDAIGRPILLRLTEGQAHDSRSAADLLVGARRERHPADRAYDRSDDNVLASLNLALLRIWPRTCESGL
ncbi:transposase, IS4 [Citreicella sp. 357]|nr:transposase, IS4 [Citreicella sp. 357]